MKIQSFGYALSIGAVAALLSACGGRSENGALPAANDSPNAVSLVRGIISRTFRYTGARQLFTVPGGVRKLTVVAVGAKGAGSAVGLGGRVWAIIPVAPGERLWIFVGGAGFGMNGGYNGGGRGVYGSGISYGGGGASDIRAGGTLLRDRILVAGGGGGQGGFNHDGYGRGGKGGGSTAGSGYSGYASSGTGSYTTAGGGGSGGTQESGGSGGAGGSGGYQSGYPGAGGVLGDGGSGGESSSGGGGGGGGGYYGGGGGGGGGYAYGGYTGGGGGGGGGSSYIEPSALAFHSWQGWKIETGNGLIVFDW